LNCENTPRSFTFDFFSSSASEEHTPHSSEVESSAKRSHWPESMVDGLKSKLQFSSGSHASLLSNEELQLKLNISSDLGKIWCLDEEGTPSNLEFSSAFSLPKEVEQIERWGLLGWG